MAKMPRLDSQFAEVVEQPHGRAADMLSDDDGQLLDLHTLGEPHRIAADIVP